MLYSTSCVIGVRRLSTMSQESCVSITSVLLGQLVDKVLFIPLVVGLVSLVDTSTNLFSVLAVLLGTGCTIAGAYYAARRAARSHVLHGILVAAITFALSFARFLSVQLGEDPSVHPLWWEFVAWASTFLAGYIGGSLAIRHATSSDA